MFLKRRQNCYNLFWNNYFVLNTEISIVQHVATITLWSLVQEFPMFYCIIFRLHTLYLRWPSLLSAIQLSYQCTVSLPSEYNPLPLQQKQTLQEQQKTSSLCHWYFTKTMKAIASMPHGHCLGLHVPAIERPALVGLSWLDQYHRLGLVVVSLLVFYFIPIVVAFFFLISERFAT